MRARPGAWRAWGLVAVLACALQTPACAGPLARQGDRYTQKKLGGSVLDLRALDPAWKQVDVEGATLAYRGPGHAAMSWTRRCGQTGKPRVLARELLLQLGPSKVEGEDSLQMAGAPAWRLHARVDAPGGPVDLRAVTRVAEGCVDDFVLVAPGDAGPYRALFERWRATFAPAAADGGG